MSGMLKETAVGRWGADRCLDSTQIEKGQPNQHRPGDGPLKEWSDDRVK